MNRKLIPVEESFAAWRKDPKYIEAYDTLDEEFARAAEKMRGLEAFADRDGAGGGCR
jgi:hypothetical protein